MLFTYVDSGTTPFTPLSLNPAIWYDASDLSTIISSGGLVSQWNDKSGNARNATEATNKPVTGTRTINGLNALDFDGTNDILNMPGIGSIGTGDNSVYVVYAKDTSSSQWIIGCWDATPNLVWGIESNATTLFGRNTSGNTLNASETITPDTTQHVASFVRNGNGANTIDIYLDGSVGTVGPTANGTGTDMVIGSRGSRTGNFFNGIIGEIIIYPSAILGADNTNVLNYLKAKWGTP